jgi:ADP-heptose:LPS heptosyltransferase
MKALHLVVLRYGKLGDIVMTTPALRWAASHPGLRVTLVTDEHYVGVFRDLLPEIEVSSVMPSCDLVLDLHRVRRSRKARRGRSWVGVGKEDVRRRLLIHFASLGFKPKYSWPERHLRAMTRALLKLGIDPLETPESIPRFEPPQSAVKNRLGLVLGAGHGTKRWPPSHWEQLASHWRGEVVAFVGPGEESLAEEAGIVSWPDGSLAGLVEGLSTCSVVVSGDTGPLHLAAALGRQVVGLFGPTPSQAGFWVWDQQGTIVRRDALGCSPCHLHGQSRCPQEHHRCLSELDPSDVLSAANDLRPVQ